MRKVTLDELLSLGAYEQVRERFRARIIAHKRTRRIFLGDEITVLFEDHDTVLHQLQEILRAERITDPATVREELATYNATVPPDGALAATLMIEIEDPQARERRRRELRGLDDALRLELGALVVRGEFDPEGRYPDRTAVVRSVTFRLPADGAARLLDPSQPVRLVLDHPACQVSTELSEAARRALARDLAPENAASAEAG